MVGDVKSVKNLSIQKKFMNITCESMMGISNALNAKKNFEINRVWIKPTSSIVGRSSDIVHALIGAFCPDFSTIVLKAYPLEYEQYREGSIGPALRASFKRRQLAMMRLYTRTYGVHAMDGARGTEGWMFRHRYA